MRIKSMRRPLNLIVGRGRCRTERRAGEEAEFKPPLIRNQGVVYSHVQVLHSGSGSFSKSVRSLPSSYSKALLDHTSEAHWKALQDHTSLLEGHTGPYFLTRRPYQTILPSSYSGSKALLDHISSPNSKTLLDHTSLLEGLTRPH